MSLLTEDHQSIQEYEKSLNCLIAEKTEIVLSETTIYFNSESNTNLKNPALSIISKKSIIKTESLKTILIANPEVVEFCNCEAHKTYKKTVIVQNIDTQLARFTIKSRPAKSAFTVFVESKNAEKENIAPGMHVRLVIHFRCDVVAECEESLMLAVQNGQSVVIKLKAHRDPPILRAFEQIHSTSSFRKRLHESSLSDSGALIDDSYSFRSKSFSSDKSSTEYTDSISSSYTSCGGLTQSTFDCKKCFVGEFAIVSTVFKNNGGNARFFIMSEMDWCSMRINDVTMKNILIVSPFAFWPAYFELKKDEQVTLYTYFFPDSYGLQADELYVVSDNCAIKTIEVVGDGIILEPQLILFDKNIKYQWFETRKHELCTILYLDLGSGTSNKVLTTTFTVTSKCELDLHYRWEINSILLCPDECHYTISRKALNVNKLKIQPSYGIFQSNSITTFTVMTNLCNLAPDQYRSTLQLIIEDVPFAAIPKKYNYAYQNSIANRRLCENTVDVYFQNLEVRLKCISEDSDDKKEDHAKGDTFMTMMNFTDMSLLSDDMFPPDPPESNTSRSDDVCRFIKGYGTCDCCQATLVSTAVLRPGGPLFVGVEAKFSAVLCNRSSKPVKYWWSNAVGSDHTKIKMKIDPKYDCILPHSSQIVTLKCLPLETGNVSSIFLPCQFNGTNPLVLSFECTIKALRVAFFFPLTYEDNFLNETIRIEWNSDEYLSKFDKETGEIKLFKPRLIEEKVIHTVELNSSESLQLTDMDTITSGNSYENEEDIFSNEDITVSKHDKINNEHEFNDSEDSKNYVTECRAVDNTDNTELSHIDLVSNLFRYEEESLTEAGTSFDSNENMENLKILPYLDFYSDLIRKNFRYLPLVIEFHITSGQSKRKRIYLQNESPIASYFFVKTKQSWRDDKDEADKDSMLDESKELMSGITLKVDPLNGEIGSYEAVFFDVIASSNTWGIYTDQITVNIDLLPSYTFWVRIINGNSPISYPICGNSSNQTPKIRFNVFKSGCAFGRRKLLVENTSSIPLYVDWHSFLINESIKEKPFSLILEMLTPFIGIDEFLLTNPSFYHAIKKFFSCALNPYQSKENKIQVNTGQVSSGSDIFGHRNKTHVQNSASLDSQLSVLKISTDEFGDSENNVKSTTSTLHLLPNNITIKKSKDTEFQLCLVPYYGDSTSDIVLITPKELFLPPKEKRYIYINVNTDKFTGNVEKIACKICGFIRIPPLFKYRDNVFFRKDGYYLPPTEVDLECSIRNPSLFIQTDKSQCIFEFFTKDFLQQANNKLHVKKKVLLKNFEEEIIELALDIPQPFQIYRVRTERETFRSRRGSVHPGESMEIAIKCTLDKGWLAKKMNSSKNGNFSTIDVNKQLTIIYKEGFTKAVPVFMKIHFPTLKSSINSLNFGEVIVGESKSLTFEIKNMQDRSQQFELQSRANNEIFTLYPTKGLLAARGIANIDVMQIMARFTPKKPGIFKGAIDIVSGIDGIVSKCSWEGQAHL
ncbi:uncharacterized protein LOC103316479 isoform X2 [Nasonia vitripennis]|uniref:Uncharacterized protein n=1 Tax=Nasonia vitripennis TaxID=7425 RepID=A0A7M7Q452_NASVI|nr:uncharacterized protein LOC103316479 isoform X2 [Nasonia vitripennis]